MGTLAALALLTYSRLSVTGAAPSARYDPPLVYDSASHALLLFGGADNTSPRNDLWAYSADDRSWKELHPRGTLPPARFGHATIYDPVRGRLIVFGGQAGGFFSDVWAFDMKANEWTQLAANGKGPSSRYGHSGIYDRKRDRLVISHGFTDSGRFDDTWAFGLADNRWTNLTPSGTKPLKRCLHHAAYDEKHDRFLLFGGCSSGFGKCPQDDLWSFDLSNNVWEQLPGGPPARERYAIAFDAAQGRLLIFGGSGFDLLNDTWSYDVEQKKWSALEVNGEIPAPRSRVEGVYAEDLDAVFWFGGSTDAGLTNELYRLDLAGAKTGIDRVVNAFSGLGGAVAPGELVTVFGSGLEAPVSFGGVAGPTLFASAEQINTRVPDAVQAGNDIQLQSGKATASVKVASTHPGIFMSVWNIDGKLNSAADPVGTGGVAVLYATGVGTDRADVSIGGAPAEVLRLGPLAGADGVVRIEVRVPVSIAPGPTTIGIVGGNSTPISI